MRALALRQVPYPVCARTLYSSHYGQQTSHIRFWAGFNPALSERFRQQAEEARLGITSGCEPAASLLSGCSMVRKTKREILDIIAVWAALESAAAASAAVAASDAQLAALGGEFQALTSTNLADQLQDYSRANLTFHQSIIQLGGCGLMAEMAGDLFVHVRAIRTRAIHQADRAERSLREHAAIITALRARDAKRAAILVRDHALGLATHVEEHWAFPEK